MIKRNAVCNLALFLGILVFFIPKSFAQERLVHFPVTTVYEGQDIDMAVKIEGAFRSAGYVRIYFRRDEQESYQYIDMQPGINQWVGKIPANEVFGERIEYFISCFLNNQTIITYPESNPYNEPEEISILPRPEKEKPTPAPTTVAPREPAGKEAETGEATPATGESQSPLLLLSPEQNEKLVAEEVLVAISTGAQDVQIDTTTIKLFLDGYEVTSRAQISSYLISYEPKNLKPGRHWIKLAVRNKLGKDIQPLVVNFSVLGQDGKQEASQQFHAHLFADVRQENILGKDQSFSMAGTEFDGNYGALRYEGRLFLTSLEEKDAQPRHRYYLSLQTDYIGIMAGDVNPYYNDLILWGKRVRGISGFLHLGAFNLDVVYGQTYRGIEGQFTTSTDSTSGQDSTVTSITRYGTYQQNLLAIRPSFGRGRNFQFGFSLVKSRDDTSSIKYGTMPKDNLVFGPDVKMAFDRNRLVITAAAAMSFLTNNTSSGAISKEDIEKVVGGDVSIPVNPADYDNWLIINDSTTPLNPTDLTSFAYNVNLRLNYYKNNFRFGFKSIGSEYLSLANSWIRKDIEGFYFSDRVRFFKNKLYVTFGYEDYTDNFSQKTDNPKLGLKTFNYAISYYPGQGYPNVSISLRNHSRDNGIDTYESTPGTISSGTDSIIQDLRQDQLNRDLSFNLGYDFLAFEQNQTVNFSIVAASRNDNFGRAENEFSSNILLINVRTRYNVPLTTTVSYSTNKNSMAAGQSDFRFNMLGFGGEYQLLDQKLTTFAELRFTGASGTSVSGDIIDYSRNHFRLGAHYYFGPRHFITLDANILTLNNRGIVADQSQKSYTDRIFRLRYERFF